MSGIGDFLTPAQRQAAKWMHVPRTGPQWGDDVDTECNHEWMLFGGPGDEWRECFLCGVQEDQ